MKLSHEQKLKYSRLSMPEKTAILLVQLGEDIATNLFSNMEVEIVIDISKHIATLKNIDKAIANAVLEEFYAILQSNQYIRSGGIKYAEDILFRTFDSEEAQKIMDNLSKSIENDQSFNYLSQIRPEQLSNLLLKEHPQTVALILAHMNSANAARTISSFPDEFKSEVTIRMANLANISPTIVQQVSEVLKRKLESLDLDKVEVGGPRVAAKMLDKLSQKVSDSTMSYIEQTDEDLAAIIKGMMFTFEDIMKLDSKDIREVLKVVSKKDLMYALKGADDRLRDRFLENMPSRVQVAFLEEMNFLGAVRVKDVKNTQAHIVDEIQKLLEQGAIRIVPEKEMID